MDVLYIMSVYYNIIIMKRIPIWQLKQKIIQQSQQSLWPNNMPVQQQLTLIYMDQQYQILSTTTAYDNKQPYNANANTNTNTAMNSSSANININININMGNPNSTNGGQYSKYSMIYQKNTNKIIWVDTIIEAVVKHHHVYYLAILDHNCRINIVTTTNIVHDIVKEVKMGKYTKYQTVQAHTHAHQQQQHQHNHQHLGDIRFYTQIKPMRKLQSCFCYFQGALYFVGNRPITMWEITSQVWKYNLQSNIWTQIFLCANTKQQKTKFNNLPKKNKQWILSTGQLLFKISKQQITVEPLIPSSQPTMGQLKIPLFTSTEPHLDPQTDTLIHTHFTSSHNSHSLLLLTKPQNPLCQPILLQLRVCCENGHSFGRKQQVQHHTSLNVHTNNNNNLNNLYANKSVNNRSNSKNIIKDKYGQHSIDVIRYDLGIFLNQSNANSSSPNQAQKQKQKTSSITNSNSNPNSNVSSNWSSMQSSSTTATNPNKLWAIINEITHIQITQHHPNHATNHNHSGSNFIKKNIQHSYNHNHANQSHIAYSNATNNGNGMSKKVLILNMYAKTRKNVEFCYFQHYFYSIPLGQLEPISLSETTKPLNYYFQKKQYCDLVFLAEKRQIHCSRHLFQFYSSKFKKLYSNSSSSKNQKNQGQTLVKLDHTKLSTIYFLVQQLYHGFAISVADMDQNTLIDLMILSHKFQVVQLQVLCEQQIKFTCQNFPKLYDYFRNSQSNYFRQEFLKFFIIHAQDIIKIMPIGKVQQLIRLVYSPQCAHSNVSQIRAKLQNNYTIKDSQSSQPRQISKSINYAGIIKSQEVILKICLKCHRLLGFNHDNHRKNKSSVRGTSLGSFGHKKKDNNSN